MHYLRGLVCLQTSDVLLSYLYVTNMLKYNTIFHSERNLDGLGYWPPNFVHHLYLKFILCNIFFG